MGPAEGRGRGSSRGEGSDCLRVVGGCQSPKYLCASRSTCARGQSGRCVCFQIARHALRPNGTLSPCLSPQQVDILEDHEHLQISIPCCVATETAGLDQAPGK